uniref:RING-type domain-containing protein n=1 Tax=Cyprinus carpio carpio TaxID=630221 RepID=A0A8C1FN55_CYPCA
YIISVAVQLYCVSVCAGSEMAEATFSQDKFSCPVCLDLLKDPVTIPCGHIYSCPQCRQTFSLRPALNKSTIKVQSLKNSKVQCP